VIHHSRIRVTEIVVLFVLLGHSTGQKLIKDAVAEPQNNLKDGITTRHVNQVAVFGRHCRRLVTTLLSDNMFVTKCLELQTLAEKMLGTANKLLSAAMYVGASVDYYLPLLDIDALGGLRL